VRGSQSAALSCSSAAASLDASCVSVAPSHGSSTGGKGDIKRLIRAVFLVGALALEGVKVPTRVSNRCALYSCMCPHTAVYVSYYYVCPHTTIHVPSYCYTCVLILPYMCLHTATHVPSYCYTCVLILRVKVAPRVSNSVQALLAPSSPAPSSPAPSSPAPSAAREVLNLLALLVQKYKSWRTILTRTLGRSTLRRRGGGGSLYLLYSYKSTNAGAGAAAAASADLPCNTCDGEHHVLCCLLVGKYKH
jgi:hypothetical protein